MAIQKEKWDGFNDDRVFARHIITEIPKAGVHS